MRTLGTLALSLFLPLGTTNYATNQRFKRSFCDIYVKTRVTKKT